MKIVINVTVNQKNYELAVEPNMTLVDMLREELRLTGTKKGCGLGECGACTILLDGQPVSSCVMLAVEAHNRKIVTIEGLETEKGLHPIQQAFVEKGAIQCGFCTSGMVLSAKALLDDHPHPDEQDIRKAISGNLCRCTGYQKIVEAVQSVSEGEQTS
ncbi:MAG: (2Fe-2S)-binding protein [Deltaproteobacteria bacterium]|nr:(2Fe-2S)-binding protein [Deltaproteobacteria bacterium]